MRVLIFEDEKHTAERLTSLLKEIDASMEILAIIGSVEKGISWFKENELPDLIFQDIQLSDGNCFEIFEAVDMSSPVIFTTAFSNFALRSFEVNSIDYIIKPYDIKDIRAALEKLKNIKGVFQLPEKDLLKEIFNKKAIAPKKRFLVKIGDSFTSINSSDIAYLISKDGVTFAKLFNDREYIVDFSIAELSSKMETSDFFQINRKMIIHINSVAEINSWFNSRLKLTLNPIIEEEIVVSRERVRSFKEWLDH